MKRAAARFGAARYCAVRKPPRIMLQTQPIDLKPPDCEEAPVLSLLRAPDLKARQNRAKSSFGNKLSL